MLESSFVTVNRWEHFTHAADMGVRGFGITKGQAFEQAALALTAVVTGLENVHPEEVVSVSCEAPGDELLFVDWLNALIYEMATRKMLFSRFEVHLQGESLEGKMWGEKIDTSRHHPAVEVKGATYTALRVKQQEDRIWIAECVVDV